MLYFVLGLSLFLIFYPYFIYPFILLIYTKIGYVEKIDKDDNYYPYVSVIIPAHNEEEVIEQKIFNTTALDYPDDKIEILIGSDGSTDQTDLICQRYANSIRFKRIEPRQGKPNVLNSLVPLAKGDILLMSDANTIIDSNALKKIIRHFPDQSIGGVCGRLILQSKTEELVTVEKRYWQYESAIKNMEGQVYSTIASNGGIYAMRKSLYHQIPKDSIIDDFWISLTILEQGQRIIFEEDAVGYEFLSMDFIGEFWRKVRIGGGDIQTFIRKPVILNKNKIINFIYYSHKVFRWMTPFAIIALYISMCFLSRNTYVLYGFFLFNFSMLVALLGIFWEIKFKLVNLTTYFFLFNFALLFGYCRYLFGKQSVAWKRAERQSEK